MKLLLSLFTSVVLIVIGCCTANAQQARFEIKETEEGLAVTLDGNLLTNYLIKSGAKPVLWPLIGPDEIPLTRQYPIRDALEFEKQDHVHHRSMWLTHGDVNGISFWDETENHGNIVHRKFETFSGGDTATIVSLNDWIGPDEVKVCSDRRTLVFGVLDEVRWIDFTAEITAGDQPVVFGDTKEGSFGIRVAGWMKVDAEQGGQIVNSNEQIDKDAWGQPAEWVDYHAPHKEQVYGIAILNHPSSYGFPTHWHVRTYGLFAANPFGLHDFYPDDASKVGRFELPAGESFKLRYRVLLHRGDEKTAKIADIFKEYAAEK
jgi:hypothetical protein